MLFIWHIYGNEHVYWQLSKIRRFNFISWALHVQIHMCVSCRCQSHRCVCCAVCGITLLPFSLTFRRAPPPQQAEWTQRVRQLHCDVMGPRDPYCCSCYFLVYLVSSVAFCQGLTLNLVCRAEKHSNYLVTYYKVHVKVNCNIGNILL